MVGVWPELRGMVRTAAERLMNSPTCSLGHPCAKRIKVARMNIGTTFTWLTIWLAAGLRMVPCQAQTAWPAAMPELTRGWSESSLTAVLPEPVQITQPAPGLAASQRSFSGLWAGWACQSASCDVKVAIERVDDQGATVAFAGANGWQSPVQDRGQGQFVGAELHTPLKTGAKLVLRLRADGDMDMSLWRAERLLSVGVLSQQAPGYTRQVVRVPTPWVENDQPVTLEMVVYRPGHASGFTTMASGTPPASPVKPMPTLVFNHGSTGDGDKPAWFKHTWVSPEVGKYFVGKGWQVVFPQRRGRGASGGLYDEGFEPDRSRYACLAEFSLPGLERAVYGVDGAVLSKDVGERTGRQREQEHRQCRRCLHHRHQGGRRRQRGHQPARRGVAHPGAGVGQHGRDPQHQEGALAQRREGTGRRCSCRRGHSAQHAQPSAPQNADCIEPSTAACCARPCAWPWMPQAVAHPQAAAASACTFACASGDFQ